MTEAEALDMAAKAAGWRDWKEAHERTWELDGMRAHAKTIVAMAELMTACEEATTRMELMYLQHQKVVDDNAALEAKLAVAREALEEIADVGDDVDCSDCKASGVSARAALKEIEGD